ncbi:hypothetical protein BK026_11880 [Alteromonas sp. V450]|uniref:glycosyltransferase n=1 Tax=Alteromonas sp. V450 TaxID=1912139 RepID=UPI0008FF2B4E|nr:glycosyltransferase [Alteromonas sp. V450]OJF69428.1 hypothetical protein BK026_11880 [Alteromonas sp. V450]
MDIAYFVLGMHRSGTSALASTLQSLGIEFGTSLLDPSEDNPKGYFENKAVQAFNETLLTHRGYSWNDVFFDVHSLDEETFADLVARAQKVLVNEYSSFSEFGVKDPRLCILFPIWYQACKNLGIKVKVVLAYREPDEIAQSLLKRNGIKRAKSYTLWADHMLKAEQYTRNFERVLIDFDELVHNFEPIATALSTFIGKAEKELPRSDNHPIDKTLKHHTSRGERNVSLPGCITDIVNEYKNATLNKNVLDKASSEFEQLKSMFDIADKADLLAQVFNERKKYKALKDDYEGKLKKQTLEIARLTELLNDAEKTKDSQYSLQEKIREFQVEKIKAETALLEMTSQRNELKQELQIKELEWLTRTNSTVEALTKENAALEHANKLAQIEIKTLEQTVSTTKLDKKAAQRAYDRSKEKFAELESAYKKVKATLADINKSKLPEKNKLKLESQFDAHARLSESNAAIWFKTAFAPIEKVLNSAAFKNTKSTSLNVLSTLKLNNRMREAITLTAQTVKTSQLTPLSFMLHFDEAGYLAANEDIEAAIGLGEFSNGLEHFLIHGFDEVFEGKRKIHLKRRYYKKTSEDEKTSLNDFIHFLRHFYEGEAFKKSKPNTDNQKAPNRLSASQNSVRAVTTTSNAEQSVVNSNNIAADKMTLSKRPMANYLSSLTAKPTVDIILPVYNALEDVKACINSLYFHSTYPFNLIVIDDCSEPETENWLKEAQKDNGFTLLRNKENLRFTKTVNKGFSESTSDYVVLLNSDTIVTAYWLEKILFCFDSDKSTGIVGPLSNAASWQTVPIREDKEHGGWLVNDIPEGYTVEHMGHLVEAVSSRIYPEVPSVNGFCYTIKRDVINKIGTLDEEYFPTGYGEEDDFSIRARKAGFTIRVADDTYVFHAKSKSYTKEVRKVLTVGGRKSLDKKHGKDEIERLIANWKKEPYLPAIGDVIASFMHESKGNKRVVYTAIFGGYDDLKEPEYINEHWDYVCFTDNPNLKSSTFTIKLVKPLFENSTKNARMAKLLSHLFLIGYDYSLWIDGSVKLRGKNIDEHIDTRLTSNYIALHNHVIRNCLYEEEDACSQAQKDTSDILGEQVAYYKKDGMPEEFGLFETAEIARAQHNATVHALNANWWQQLDRFSIRDQISLPYVFWKHGYDYAQMPGTQWIDAYFHMYKHRQMLEHNKEYIDVLIPVSETTSDVGKLLSQIASKTKYSNFGITVCAAPNVAKTMSLPSKVLDTDVQLKVLDGSLTPSAINNVVKELKGEYACILQPSVTLINSDWLSMLRWGFDRDNNVFITGPTVLDQAYNFVASGLRLKRKNGKITEVLNSAKLGATGSVGALHEDCVLLNRKRFLQQGGFDKDLLEFRSAIVDFCNRVTKVKGHNYLVLHAEIITDKKSRPLADNTLLLEKLGNA